MKKTYLIKDRGKGLVENLTPDKLFDIANGGLSNETDPIFSASPSVTITNSDINNWNNKLNAEVDTLQSVVNRGNYSPKYLTFTGTTNTPTIDGAIGMNPTTYSMYFGNMNQNHTGYYNIALGYNSMPKLTSNHYNVAVGSYAGSELTTGQSNSFFGSSAGYKLTTGGWNVLLGEIAGQAITTGNYNTIVGGEGLYSNVGYKNTSLGYSTGYWDNTGNLGTYIGYKTANGNKFGNNNLMLGNYAGGKNWSIGGVGTMGDNNLFIGTGAGYNDTGLSNKLIIHSNGSLSGFSNTAEGNFTTNAGNFNNALITGDFAVRWFKLNGSLIVNPSYLTADATFTKNVVAKPDGTFGWENKLTSLRNAVTITDPYINNNIKPEVAKIVKNNTIQHSDINDTNNPITITVTGNIDTYLYEPFDFYTVYGIVVTLQPSEPSNSFTFINRDGSSFNYLGGTKIWLPANTLLRIFTGIIKIL